ncbi:MAG: Hint domain-containing protein [Paracoccaceae bacterium]
MADYSFNLIPAGDVSFTGGTPDISDGGGWGWQWVPFTFTYTTENLTTISVTDDDALFQDDPMNPEWSGGTWPAHSQVFSNSMVIGGSSYSAGTQIENEYELNVQDEDGNIYRLVAVSAYPDTFAAHTIVGFTFEGAWPPEGAVLTSIPGTAQDGETMVPCFVRGTLIDTPGGMRPVQTLAIGDAVRTVANGDQPIRWIGGARVAGRGALAPIRFAPGAIGNTRALWLSPHHRVLVRSPMLEYLFALPAAFVEARHLVNGTSIRLAPVARVEYWHILLDRHETVLAEGAPVESLYLGPVAEDALGAGAMAELRAIFPDLPERLARDCTALPCLKGWQARMLA